MSGGNSVRGLGMPSTLSGSPIWRLLLGLLERLLCKNTISLGRLNVSGAVAWPIAIALAVVVIGGVAAMTTLARLAQLWWL